MRKILLTIVAVIVFITANAQSETNKTTPTKGTAKATLTVGSDTQTDVEWVQLWEGGPKWAVFNVGATKVGDYGGHYDWGKSVDTAKDGSYSSSTTDIQYGDDDTAKNLWGGNWQMPTSQDLAGLLDFHKTNCGIWTNNYKSTGIAGLIISGLSGTEYESNSVFFPASGYSGRSGVVDNYYNTYGFYWSSTPSGGDKAYDLYFDNSGTEINKGVGKDGSCKYGFSVRAIVSANAEVVEDTIAEEKEEEETPEVHNDDTTLEIKDFSNPKIAYLGAVIYDLDSNISFGVAYDKSITTAADTLTVNYYSTCMLTIEAKTGIRIKSAEFTFADADHSPSASGSGYDASQSTPGLVVSGNTVTSGCGWDETIKCANATGSHSLELTGIKLTYEKIDNAWMYDSKNNTISKDTVTLYDVVLYDKNSTDKLKIGYNTNTNVTDLDLRGRTFNINDAKEYTIEQIGYSDDLSQYHGFNSNTYLRSIIIPASVKILDAALSYCPSLSSVQFEDGSQLHVIGSLAFASCFELKSISLPKSVSKIDQWAFLNTPADITLASVPEIYDWKATGNVTVNLSDDSFVYTDNLDKDYSLPKPNKISYSRTLPNMWGTIVLPFDVPIDEDDRYKFFSIEDVENNVLSLSPITSVTLPKGTPVFIYMQQLAQNSLTGKYELNINTNDSVLSTKIKTPDKYSMDLVGSYTSDTLKASSGTNYYIAGNYLWKSSSEFYLPAFHAYLHTNSASAAKTGDVLTIADPDNETTAIGEISADGSVTFYDHPVYNLAGQRQRDLQHGQINIIDGKKIYVK